MRVTGDDATGPMVGRRQQSHAARPHSDQMRVAG